MKARVKGIGKIVTIVKNIGYPGGYVASDGKTYRDEDLTLIVDEEPDYWTKLEHQYAGMAMQGLLQSPHLNIMQEEPLVGMASSIAHALVEKMKEERK